MRLPIAIGLRVTSDAVGADGATRRTVLLAMTANLAIAASKIVAGAVTGSPAMLSEAAHSVADTVNELFLLASLSRSQRRADVIHPFGYGKERFFWSMLAAVGIFVTGACFSFYQGVTTFGGPTEHTRNPAVAYAVLGVALAAEGTSLARALWQISSTARSNGRTLRQELRHGGDPTVRTVFAEDLTAVVGVVFAAAGLFLHQLTGSPAWEGVAAFAISGLLAYAAYLLGRDSRGLLIGQAAEPQVRLAALDFLERQPEIDVVLDVLTMQLSPSATLLAARVDLADGLDSNRVEEVSGRIKQALAYEYPHFSPVFLDITDATAANVGESERQWRQLRAEAGAARAPMQAGSATDAIPSAAPPIGRT